jgi:hypothetical protein
VVDVPDGANVDVGLRTIKFLFRHLRLRFDLARRQIYFVP